MGTGRCEGDFIIDIVGTVYVHLCEATRMSIDWLIFGNVFKLDQNFLVKELRPDADRSFGIRWRRVYSQISQTATIG